MPIEPKPDYKKVFYDEYHTKTPTGEYDIVYQDGSVKHFDEQGDLLGETIAGNKLLLLLDNQ